MSAGDTVPVPGWSMGGRGQQKVEPYEVVRHVLRMRTISESTHGDHYLTAEDALKARVRRLKERGVAHTVEGNKVMYTAHNGDHVTLEYLTPDTVELAPEGGDI